MRPFVARAVPAELHSVFIGIAQIKGFAHSMIGGSVELNTGVDYAAKCVAQFGTSRIKNSQMIKPSRSRWRRGTATAFPSVKANVVMIASSGNERSFVAKFGDEFKPKYAA